MGNRTEAIPLSPATLAHSTRSRPVPFTHVLVLTVCIADHRFPAEELQSFSLTVPPTGHNFIAFESTTPVPSLVAAAHGIVLDLGPGAGTQLDRFDAARVAHIYGVEPNTAFAPAFNDRLRETALGLDGKYTLVSCGVEDGEELARSGVVDESVDCVVCMQVLVSPLPRPFPPSVAVERDRIGWLLVMRDGRAVLCLAPG